MSVYILGGARTPQASFLSKFASLSATELGARAIAGALKKTNIDIQDVDEVFMGQVLQAGSGQAPARQAALSAGLLESVPCTTINKVCGSGLKSIISAAQTIKSKDGELIIAGGMESMSLAPHLLFNSRTGVKFGDGALTDSMGHDGLRDAYTDQPMGACAEECAEKFSLSREEQDQYSIESFKRAQKAIEDGVFKEEIVPVLLKTRKGEILITEDEGPSKVKFEKIPSLRPAFKKNGTITAANASTLSDGACALLIGGEKYKSQAKFKIHAYANHAQNPTWFTTAPVEAMRNCLEKASMGAEDIDLWEINEAFAVVAMVAIKELELDHNKVNIYGGGVSLGHPLGASGARIILSLMNSLERENKKWGMASLCIGGGEALAMIIERL